MGDYGKVAVNAGYARFDARDFGKVGAEYTYQGELGRDPDIGYKLGAKANALIGRAQGVNGGVYAGVELGKTNCTQYNIGLMADYTQVFSKDKLALPANDKDAVLIDNLNADKSFKAGGEVGFTRNLCCDDNRKFGMSLLGGVELYSEPEVNTKAGFVQNSSKLKKVVPFLGAKAEYATKVNRKGNELFINGACYVSDKGTTYGEAGIGFRF